MKLLLYTRFYARCLECISQQNHLHGMHILEILVNVALGTIKGNSPLTVSSSVSSHSHIWTTHTSEEEYQACFGNSFQCFNTLPRHSSDIEYTCFYYAFSFLFKGLKEVSHHDLSRKQTQVGMALGLFCWTQKQNLCPRGQPWGLLPLHPVAIRINSLRDILVPRISPFSSPFLASLYLSKSLSLTWLPPLRCYNPVMTVRLPSPFPL